VGMDKLDKLSKYRVLYVEDEPIIRENVTEILTTLFDNVFIAKNGVEAMDIYSSENLDLIITDINMPKLNGLEMVKTIREKDKDIDFILTTAFTEQQYLLDAVELNIIKYVIKPLNSTKLIDVLYKFLEKIEPPLQKVSNQIYFDNNNYKIISNDESIQLTNKESKFLSLLLSTRGVVDYSVLENSLNEYSITSVGAIHTLVKKLRKKIPEELIVNVQGIGYKLDRGL
jgi:DNA-binding response OmpR family regulator